MGEVIGLAASVIALGGAAMTAAKLADSMIRVAHRVLGAEEDVENFANSISAWAGVISLAHRSIKHHAAQERSQSLVLQFMENESILEQLLKQVRQVRRDIRKIRKPIRNLVSPIKIWPRLKWFLQRKDVAELGFKMESVKTSLLIVINVVHMEAAQHRGDEDEIKELKKQIKLLNNTIQVLLERQRYKPPALQQHHNPAELSSSTALNVQEVLLELGQNMVEHGTVPEINSERSSTRSSGSFVEVERPNERHLSQRSLSMRHSTSSSSSMSSKHRNTVEIVTPSTISRSSLISQTQIQTVIADSTNDEKTSRRDIENSTVESSEELAPLPPVTPEEVSPPQELAGPSTTSTDDSNFRSVQPRNHEIKYNPRGKFEVLKAFVIHETGSTTMTVHLDEALPENIISTSMVEKIGLQIEPHNNPEDWISIQTADGNVLLSCGWVKFRWIQKDSGQKRPFRVRCLVYETGVEGAIFGQPFVRRREFYTKKLDSPPANFN